MSSITLTTLAPVVAPVLAAAGESGVVGLLITLVVGGLVGWVASIVMGTNAQQGILLNIVIGIVGSMLGHFLARQLGIVESGQLASILVAIGGAVVLILILRMLRILR